MPERYAIYYAPDPSSTLWSRATQWLGRDPGTGERISTDIAGISLDRRLALTESARRYGFHATLKAPMVLAEGQGPDGLHAALRAFAGRRAPVRIGRLKLAVIDGFIALVPEVQSAELSRLAADIVEHFDQFRAPLAADDRARRLDAGLTGRQIELLDRYGYPYVFEEFRFHMTLTDRLGPEGQREFMAAAERWFGDALAPAYVLDRLSLYYQLAGTEAFERRSDFALRAEVPVDA